MAESLVRRRYRLRKQAVKARASDRTVVESVADDLNELLAPVMAVFMELQRDNSASREQRKRLSVAISCMYQSRLMVRQLLDYANVREVRRVRVDVHEFLRSLEPALRTALPTDIHARFDIPRSLPPACIDEQLMVRALLSVVLDARSSMPEGGLVLVTAGVDLWAGTDRTMIRLSVYKRDEVARTENVRGYDNSSAAPMASSTRGMAMVRQLMEHQGGKMVVGGRPPHAPGVHLWLPIATTSATSP